MSVLPSLDQKSAYVNRMFAEIAPRYDLMNRLMTGGQDVVWRQELVELCELPPHGRLLDVGTGTGDIAYEALRQHPSITALGCDFTFEMMAFGKAKPTGRLVRFVQGDGLHLPFADDYFDAVTSGFVMRNVVDIDAALREQKRVTKPGGKVVCLETAPPTNAMLEPLFRFYFFNVVPFIGGMVSGDGEAYAYLPNSTVDFPEPSALQRTMELAGLRNVFYRELMMGAVVIHAGTK